MFDIFLKLLFVVWIFCKNEKPTRFSDRFHTESLIILLAVRGEPSWALTFDPWSSSATLWPVGALRGSSAALVLPCDDKTRHAPHYHRLSSLFVLNKTAAAFSELVFLHRWRPETLQINNWVNYRPLKKWLNTNILVFLLFDLFSDDIFT